MTPSGLGPEVHTTTAVQRYGVLHRAGGLLAPLLTALLAFLIAGIVVLISTGSFVKPFETYKAIFDGSGLNWFLPWNTCTTCLAALNLQQTLLVVDTARPHRARRRLRVPVWPVQHRRAGAVPDRLDRRGDGRWRLANRSTCPVAHMVIAVVAAMLAGACSPGSPAFSRPRSAPTR